MKTSSRTRRARYSALLATTAMVGGVGLAGIAPASAADGDSTLGPVINGTDGTIVITKYSSSPSDGHDNGLPNSEAGSGPLEDVGFTVCAVEGYDLDHSGIVGDVDGEEFGLLTVHDIEWWEMASTWAEDFNIDPEAAIARFELGSCGTEDFTDEDGIVQFVRDLGLYLVSETTPPPTSAAITPFLVTLPLQNVAVPNSWITPEEGSGIETDYVVYTYPKNAQVTVTKTADTSETYSVGSQIAYNITTPKPLYDDQYVIESFRIVDTLNTGQSYDPPRLTFATADKTGPWSIFVGATEVSGGSLDPCVTDPEDPDYGDVPFSVAYTGTPTTVVTFTACPGGALLSELNAAANSTVVSVDLTATLGAVTTNTSAAAASGHVELTNRADAYWDDASGYDTETSYVGGVMITKRDTEDGHFIPGAQFQLYTAEPTGVCTDELYTTRMACLEHGEEWTWDAGIAAIDQTGATVTTFITSSSGAVGMLDLNYDPVEHEGSCNVDGRIGDIYWIVETQAPTGYVAQGSPIQVCVTGPLDGDAGHTTYDDYVVDNTPHNAGFPLPFTGDWSQDLPMWIAVAVITVAFTVYVIRTRKHGVQIAGELNS